MFIRLPWPSNHLRGMSMPLCIQGGKGMQTTRQKKRRSGQGAALFCSRNYYFRVANCRQHTNTQQFSFIKGSILNKHNLYNYFKIDLRQKCAFNKQMVILKRTSEKKKYLVESKPAWEPTYLHS